MLHKDEYLDALDEDALKIDGFDNCIIGVSSTGLLIYSYDKIIFNLMQQGMTRTYAIEYYSFNIEGAYVGEGTPILMEAICFED